MATSTTYGGYIAKVQDIDLAAKFARDARALAELLSASDLEIIPSGTSLKTYTNTCTLQDGSVNENTAITMSTYSGVAATKELTFKKWGKPASLEKISQLGFDGAVEKTDNQLIRDVQKAVRATIVAGIATGTGEAEGVGFQAAIANAWAAVYDAFEDEDCEMVHFVNATTLAKYLGTASITVQTQFGVKYIEDFMGLGRIIIDSNVADDTIYSTAKENLIVAAARVTDVPDVYMDESGIIAVCHEWNANKASYETYVYTGLCVFPMFANRVVITDITDGTDGTN